MVKQLYANTKAAVEREFGTATTPAKPRVCTSGHRQLTVDLDCTCTIPGRSSSRWDPSTSSRSPSTRSRASHSCSGFAFTKSLDGMPYRGRSHLPDISLADDGRDAGFLPSGHR
jgi:hypothetical protein